MVTPSASIKRDLEPRKTNSQAPKVREGWDASGFKERLIAALDGRVEAEVARAAGMKPQTLGGYKEGSEPSAQRALALADALGINVRWLIKGEGPRSVAESIDAADWLELPRYDLLRFDAEAIPERVETMRIRRDWISRAVRSTGRLWVTELPGDAMPDIGRDGDTVLCEDAVLPLVDGRVYAFMLDRRPIVRKVQVRPEGLVLKASAPDVDPITVEVNRLDTLVPIGRVLASISLQAV